MPTRMENNIKLWYFPFQVLMESRKLYIFKPSQVISTYNGASCYVVTQLQLEKRTKEKKRRKNNDDYWHGQ